MSIGTASARSKRPGSSAIAGGADGVEHQQGAQDIRETLGVEEDGQPPRRWRLVWIGFAILLALAIFIRLGGGPADDVAYETTSAQRGALRISVTATGNLGPTNQVDVGIEVSGTVDTVFVDHNDPVEVGQALARLDTTKLEAQARRAEARLRSAEAAVQQAEATVRESRLELERLQGLRELSGGEIPARSDLDRAEAVLDRSIASEANARASVFEARANLRVAETDLDKAVIYSPIDGIVLQRNVESGQTVAASLQTPVLFTLAEDLTQMELLVDVDEADVGWVREGQPATFTVDAYPDRMFSADVTQVRYGAQEVAGVVTYKTVLNVDNDHLLLRPGMTATADIVVRDLADVMLVPNAALRFSPPESSSTPQRQGLLGRLLPRPPGARRSVEPTAAEQRVWVSVDGSPVPVPIDTGASDGINTEVLSGDLEVGAALITNVASSR